MQRYIIEDTRHVPPFNQPASLLTIGTRPLKLHHEDVFLSYFKKGIALGNMLTSPEDITSVQGPAVVYRDSLWFDVEFLETFMERALKSGRACRAAFPADD